MTKWTDKIKARNAGEEKNAPWWVNDKLKLHKWAKENNLPMPEVYRTWDTPEELDLDNLPAKFVLKPSVMFSSWGVMLLELMPNGNYWESLKNRELSVEQIKKEQLQAYDRCKYKKAYRLMVEERIDSPEAGQDIPLDYKAFSYFGEVHLVQQINRNHKPIRINFFDGNFNGLDLDSNIVTDWTGRQIDPLVKPQEWERLLQIAREVTVKLATPFMRVDMYVGDNGPIIGELTPSPGDAFYGNNYRFAESLDLFLGEQWVDAERRIEAMQQKDSLR